MFTVKYIKLRDNAQVPRKAHEDDAGFDLYSCENKTLMPHCFSLIPTGIAIALPKGTEAQVRPRSGLAAKHGITVLNAPGTIDAGYRGEVMVLLINHSEVPFEITEGMRIAQLMVKPIYETEFIPVEALDDTERSTGGYGSTGL